MRNEGGEACSKCMRLHASTLLKNMGERAHQDVASSTIRHNLLTHSQLVARSDMHRVCHDTARLEQLNAQRVLTSTSRTLSTTRRLVLAISRSDIPRVQQLLAVQLRQRQSPAAIIEKLADAVGDQYEAKVRVCVHVTSFDLFSSSFLLLSPSLLPPPSSMLPIRRASQRLTMT